MGAREDRFRLPVSPIEVDIEALATPVALTEMANRKADMKANELLVEAYGRILETVQAVLKDVTNEQLVQQTVPDSNTIGWLIWHLSRVQDDHLAEVAGLDQVWTRQGWAERVGLPFEDAAIGFGQSPDEVAKVQVESAGLLMGYYHGVHDQTIKFLGELSDRDLDRVVDESWDPPVTLGVRLVSVLSDDLQHAGQAAYLRGLIDKGWSPF